MVFGPGRHFGKLVCRPDSGHDVNIFQGLTMPSRFQAVQLC
jgi:hypothetical protein